MAVVLEDGTVIAMVMALVAMFGAIAASRAGTAEEETAVLENKLSQRQIIELTEHQDFMDRTAQRGRFEVARNQALPEGRRLRKEADELRASDPVQAARRDVEAQEEFDAARLLEPYLSITRVSWLGDSKLSLPQIIDKNVAYKLQHIGFGSRWTEPGKSDAKAASIWQGLQEQIKEDRKKLIWLTVAVVIFVAALGCFTLAELWRHNTRRMLLMLVLGLVVVAAGLLLTMYKDPPSKLTFLEYTLGFVGFGFLGTWVGPYIEKFAKTISVRLGFLKPDKAEEKEEDEKWPHPGEEDEEFPHPGEVEPRLFPGMRMHVERTQRAFAILVILLIVFTVLLSAILGNAYSQASTEASSRASSAADSLVEGFRNSHSGALQFRLGTLATAQEQRMRYQAALQRADLARLGFLTIDQEKVDESAKRWKQLFDSQPPDNVNLLYGDDPAGKGPEKDPRYPRSLLYGDIKKDSYVAFAQSDADNELSLAYQTRAKQFLMILTWLAIALYLFGQSLTMMRQLKAASMLVVFGVVLVGAGVGVAAVQQAKKLHRETYSDRPECRDQDQKKGDAYSEAARHYAEGKVLEDTATTRQDYADAAKEFECALDARPAFALANYYLSQSSEYETSPQSGEEFTSIIPEESIVQIVEHDNKAMNGFDRDGLVLNSDILGSYGWHNYMLGLIKKKPQLIKRSLEETQQAINSDTERKAPFLRFNLGVTQLALGNFPAAELAYKDALSIPPDDLQYGLAVASINDLEVLLHYCPGILNAADCTRLRRTADDLKQRLVAAAWPAPKVVEPRGDEAPTIGNIGLVASPAGLGWHARLENFNFDRDALTVLWYKFEPKWNLWRGLSYVSFKVDPKKTHMDADGNTREFRSYLTATNQHSCAENGEYRAEFYLNGKLLDLHPTAALDTSPLKAASFGDLNISLCYPESWERWRPDSAMGFPQFMTGGYTKDHSDGVFAFEYYFPRERLDDAAKKILAQRSLAYLNMAKFFSVSRLSSEPNSCTVYPADQTVLRWKSEDGTVRALARVWASGEGIVHVGAAVHHSKSDAERAGTADPLGPKSEECDALRSMREVYPPNR